LSPEKGAGETRPLTEIIALASRGSVDREPLRPLSPGPALAGVAVAGVEVYDDFGKEIVMTRQNPNYCQRPLHTVLIGSSLEGESDQVVRSGLAVARAAGARVLLVHAMPSEPRLAGLETGLGDDFIRQLTADGWERLRRQIERLGIRGPELAGAEVLAGEPHRVLGDAARTAGVDLIVVGATGSGPFAAKLLGSTADRVLRKATCPVLLIRGELRVPPQRVLAAVDLSDLSGDAFRCGMHLVAQLAHTGEIEVQAVHALSFVHALEQPRQGELSYEEVERREAENLRRFVLENRNESPLEVTTSVLPGEARFEILRELAERPVDLVVLGTHGRGGLDRLVLGSVASTVARKAPCSVLLISPEAAWAEDIAEAIVSRTTPAWHRDAPPVA
jgi:nucleotide-binding universal stress UspA family protein